MLNGLPLGVMSINGVKISMLFCCCGCDCVVCGLACGVETLSSRLGEIEELQKGVREFSEEIERFREKLLKYSVLGKLEGFDRKVEVYRKYNEGLTEAVAQIESVEEDLSTGREVLEFMYKEREGVLAELGEFKVCPLCGSSLEGAYRDWETITEVLEQVENERKNDNPNK